MKHTTKSACILNLENGPIMKRSIDRLLKEGIEVLVCDNNSHDGSKEILESYKGKIKYWIWNEIKGQAYSRNLMMKESHGDYVMLLDGDILYYPNSFDYLVKRFKTAPKNVKVIGYYPWRYTNDESKVDKELPVIDEPLLDSGQPIALTQYGVFKRELFEKYNIWFDNGFGTGYGAEDNDYALQMLQQGFICRSVPLIYYHNKHTEHWFKLHTPGTMRVKERQDYFKKKWGEHTYEDFYRVTPSKNSREAELMKLFGDGNSLYSPLHINSNFKRQKEIIDEIFPPDKYPKVAIGVGICPRTEYARKLWIKWYKRQTYPEYKTILIIDENSGEENARASRQRIRDRFMDTDAEYLFFGDVDTIPPDNVIETLLSGKKDIITGLTTGRHDESVLAFWKHGYPEQKDKVKLIHETKEDIIPIDGAGLYCSLISRKVLEKVNFGWESIIDDAEFYMRAKVLGFQPYLNPKVLCKHYYNNKEYNFPQI